MYYNEIPTLEECQLLLNNSAQHWRDINDSIPDCERCLDRNHLIECKCGCGQITTRKNKTGTRLQFISGHKKHVYVRFGSDNSAWTGDKVKYSALHQYVRRWLIKPDLCENCKRVPPKDIYCTNYIETRNLDDWVYLCRLCIMHIDGRSTMSHKQREETKEKISKSKTGIKIHTETSKEKLRQGRLGKKTSLKTRRKIGRAQLGKKRSAATREKMRLSRLKYLEKS